MNNYRKYLQSKGYSQTSIDTFYKILIAFINWCEDEAMEAEQATYTDLLAYIHHLQKRKLTQKSIDHYIKSIGRYYHWLIKQGIRQDNPCRNIDIKGIKRRILYDILSKAELEALYNDFAIPEENTNQNILLLTAKRNKVMLGFMICQGMGTTELSKLSVNDLKLREGRVHITGNRKSNPRTLTLQAYQVLDLMEYTLKTREKILQLSGQQTQQLIVSTRAGQHFVNLTTALLQKLKVQNPKVSSIKQVRASVITHWLKNYNLRKVQYMAGHRYISSTEAYLINDLEDLKEDIIKYHPLG